MVEVKAVRSGKLKLGEKTKCLAFFELSGETQEVVDERMHHIHILDRSGSMWSHIDDLMEDVKKTLRMCSDEDLITVLWFSGAGQYRTILKGVKAAEREDIDKILDSLKSTVGCTCFSDPLKELQQIVEETAPICSIFNVTIFTDGDTVTPWSVQEETRRIFENLDAVKNKIVAFNAVGYGNYYNRRLLLDMVKTTEYGELTHASKIEEYSHIFNANKKKVENLTGRRFNLKIASVGGKDYGLQSSDIIGLTTKTVKFGRDEIKTRLAKARNTYAAIFDYDENCEYFAEVGDIATKFEVSDRDWKLYDKEVADILYAYAYKLFEEGARKESMEVLNFLGDKTAMDRQINAFTVSEVGEHCKYLHDIVFDTDGRMLGEVEPNSYMPDKNAYCVFELLQDLISLEAKYLPVKDYNRVSRKRVDEFNLFEADENISCVDLSKLILSQDRLNISIRFEVPGKVKLNPKRAKSVGLPNEVPAVIYRTHTIIRDGNVNVPEIKVILIKSDLEYLHGKLGNFDVISEIAKRDDGSYIVSLDLTKLPVINESYLEKATAQNFLDLELQMLDIEAQNKIINSKVSEEEKFVGSGKTSYTAEQVAVLVEHGMKTPGVYTSINPTQQEIEDYVVIREFKTQIKGLASLPALKKVEDKLAAKKPFTAGEALLHKWQEALAEYTSEDLVNLKRINSGLLSDIRLELSGCKLALIFTGAWMEGLKKQDEESYTYEDAASGKTLVLQLRRKEVAI